jgi:hypothetical protein
MNTENIALGTLKFPQKATVEKKEMTLFTSDKKDPPIHLRLSMNC